MRIKVLWIDDEYKKQSDVIGDAEQDGIDIIPFESHEEGIEALMSNIKGFHAVILDAKVKKGRYDTVTGLSGLTASRDKLIEINNQGTYLPSFIFTGQPDYMDNDMFSETYGEYLDYINIISGEYIWTLIDTDNGLYLVNGRHFVNRINYIICEIPHNINERIEYKYDDHGENR